MPNVTLSLPDDLLQQAEAAAHQRGEDLSALLARLLQESVGGLRPAAPAEGVPRSPLAAQSLELAAAIADAEALEVRLVEKYQLAPLSPELRALRGYISAPPDVDYKQLIADSIWERYNRDRL